MALWGFCHHVLAINAINICIQYVWMSFLSPCFSLILFFSEP